MENVTPQIFKDLAGMRGQECDRPKCIAIELSKIGAVVVSTANYDTLYVWPLHTPEQYIAPWHRDNNAGDKLIFHINGKTLSAEMPEDL